MGAAERGRMRAASARAAGFRSTLLPAHSTACTQRAPRAALWGHC